MTKYTSLIKEWIEKFHPEYGYSPEVSRHSKVAIGKMLNGSVNCSDSVIEEEVVECLINSGVNRETMVRIIEFKLNEKYKEMKNNDPRT